MQLVSAAPSQRRNHTTRDARASVTLMSDSSKEEIDHLIEHLTLCGVATSGVQLLLPSVSGAPGESKLIILDQRRDHAATIETITNLRHAGAGAPILAIIAHCGAATKAAIIAAGADDYVDSGADSTEFEARVRAVISRPRHARFFRFAGGRMRLDPAKFSVWWDAQQQALNPTQFGILWLIATRFGTLISIEEICMELFGECTLSRARTCRAYISKARKQLRLMEARVRIACRVGEGYSLEED